MTSSKPGALLKSLFLSYLLSGILLLALAFLFYKLKLKEPQINAAIHVIYVAVCLTGGFLAGKRIGQRRFFWGLLSGLLYFLVLLAVSLFLNQGLPDNPDGMLTVMGCCLAGGTLGGMLS